ncbi:MAG: CopG family transcriptional regulator [Actinomycetota bacterium]
MTYLHQQVMLTHMRTTIRLPDDLYRQAKHEATSSGRTFTEFLEDAVRRSLALRTTREQVEPYRIRPLPGHDGLQRGVDLDNTAALLNLMEGR